MYICSTIGKSVQENQYAIYIHESHIILQYIYSIYNKSELIFIAECSIKRSEQFNAKFI